MIDAALERARDDARGFPDAPPDGRPRTRHLAIGDPQAPFETFLALLDRRGLLGADGRLVPDAALVSIGDHFDWGKRSDRDRAAEGGSLLVAWLAAHPADQVTMILGNHDVARVGELAPFDDRAFAATQVEADAAYRDGQTDPALEAAFLKHHPELPTAEIAARDFSSFRATQRERVTRLVRAKRFRLASSRGGWLLVHAGVTRDELDGLGLSAREQSDAGSVAAALNEALDRAVERWTAGPLAIPVLHQPGDAGHGEGRGILYHRPGNPAHEDPALYEGPPRRRFDPRRLPTGLRQAIGHIRDGKCRKLLAEWAASEPEIDGPLRHLETDGHSVRYARGVKPGAQMHFLDGGMLQADPARYELLDLDAGRPA